MSLVRYIVISPDEAGQRLDNFLIKTLKGVPKSHIYRIIRGGEVRVNKKRAEPSTRLMGHDSVRLPPMRMALEKEYHLSERTLSALKSSIIHEDDDMMVLNKPAGFAVHGGSGLSLGVIEALRTWRPEQHYLELVHRLDKETSGCLLIAKKRSVLRALQALLRERRVEKIYWALVADSWQGKQRIRVTEPLLKNILSSGERMVMVDQKGKEAQTDFKLLQAYASCALVEARPKTGRTHQIRVHAAFLKHPIIGDAKYGSQNKIADRFLDKNRLYLHAKAIQFVLSGKSYSFNAELDPGFTKSLDGLASKPSI